MIAVTYKRDRLIAQSVGILLLSLGGLWLGLQSNFGLSWRLLGWLLAVALPFVSVALARKAIDGQLAIREIANGLELASLYGSRTIPWKNRTAIHREVLQQSSGLGLIKQDVAHYIVFTGYEVDAGEISIKIQEDLIDWPKHQLGNLFELLTSTWKARTSGEDSPSVSRPQAPGFAAQTFGRKAV